MARAYKRDARGRFAGGGGSSRPTVTGGSLKARSAATRARRKLAGQDPADSSVKGTLSRRSQKGAVTRTGRAAQAAGQANRTKISARPAGVVGRGGKVRGAKAKPAGAAPKPGAVALDQVRRYNNLDRARNRQKQTFDREISRVGSSNRLLANQALPKAQLALRKVQRIEATMRRLSNSPDSPNVPRLPRAKQLGETITGRRNLYRRVTPRVKAAAISGVVKKPKAKPAPAAAPAPARPRGVTAASKAYAQRVRNALGMRFLGAKKGGIRSATTGRQGNLFGGSDSIRGYQATGSQVRPGRYKRGRVRSGSYRGQP